MAGHSHNTPLDYVRKGFIVCVLLGIVVLINQFAPEEANSSSLVALGFVVLAA